MTDTPPRIAKPVLIVLASAQRRGAEIQGAAMAEWLSSRGHEASVTALAPGGGDPLDVEILGAQPRSGVTLRALRSRIRGSLVVAHGSDTLPMVAIGSMGLRLTWVYRSVGDPQAWVRGPLQRLRTATFLARAGHVVALWDGAADSIHRLYRVPHRKLTVIANHRSAVAFPPVTPDERAAARALLGVDGKVVAYLGSLTEEKRPLDAVRAIAPLHDATLLVAGRGVMYEDMERLAALVAPGRVRMLGESPAPAGVIAAADVILLPSRTEGMPGVLIESRLRRVPAVATAVGAVPSMINDGIDGFVVAPGDVAAMSARLAEVLADPSAFTPAPTENDDQSALRRWEGLLARLASR